MSNPKQAAIDFLYKHGDFTRTASHRAVDLLTSNGFSIAINSDLEKLQRENERLSEELTGTQTANQCMTEDFSAMKSRAETAEAELDYLRSCKPIKDVIAERRRQIEVEGYSSEHDDTHDKGELAGAAACYALAGVNYTAPDHYPPRKEYAAVVDARNSIPEKDRETTREAIKLAFGEPSAPGKWPFHASSWKPTDRRQNLTKAAAFIIAEMDRLDRAST